MLAFTGPVCTSMLLTMLALNQDQEVAYPVHQLEGTLTKRPGALLLRSFHSRWIDEAPVYLFGIAGKGRARLAHAITHRDNVVKGLVAKLVEMPGSLLADIDVHTRHGLYGQRMQFSRLASRAVHLDAARAHLPNESSSHF